MSKVANSDKSSGQRTRIWLKSLGYRVENVESMGIHGYKRDFLGFIDDLAFYDDYMIGIQSCYSKDLKIHQEKFAQLCAKNSIICAWMQCAELWLVWWSENKETKTWYPNIEILNPAFEVKRRPNAVLQLVE